MAIVKKYKVKVIGLKKNNEDLYAIDLLSLGKSFKYEPGQFLHLALEQYDPSSAWPESRCFSMQSNEDEDHIRLTYSVKGDFTNKMSELINVGTELWIKLPFGDLFTQDHKKENTVFIAGGTGITPFLSLFTSSRFSDYSDPHLYAGFRNKQVNLYNSEIEKAKEINPSFTVNYLYQDQKGVIDIARILEKCSIDSSFFISGPPLMIKHFKKYLIENGVPENHVKTDEWE